MEFAEFKEMNDSRFIVIFPVDFMERKIVSKAEHEKLFNYIARWIEEGYPRFWDILHKIDKENHPESQDYYNLSAGGRLNHPDFNKIAERTQQMEIDMFDLFKDAPNAGNYVNAGWIVEIDEPY